MITLKIRSALLRAIAAFASTDETRYVIGGVLLDCKGRELRLVATNGRSLVAVRPRDGYSDAGDISVILRRQMIEAIPLDWEMVSVTYEAGQRPSIEHGDMAITASAIDGVYPNWEMLVPPDGSLKCETDELSTRLPDLARFAKLLAEMNDEGKARVLTTGERGILSVHAVTSRGEMLGLAMQCDLQSSASLAWARKGSEVAA